MPATQKLLKRLQMSLDDFDIIELNEAFSAQALACTRQLGLADDDPRINTRGGAIALGHPLGMSGARLAVSAMDQLHRGEAEDGPLRHVHRRRARHCRRPGKSLKRSKPWKR